MIRRYAISTLAVLAMGFVVAAPAEAGGSTGAVGIKKNATVIVKNTTTAPYYVLVVPDSLLTSTKFGTFGTVGWAKKLGGTLLNPGRTLSYPVPAGPGQIGIIDPALIVSNPAAIIPASAASGFYSFSKGKTVTKTVKPGPVIQ